MNREALAWAAGLFDGEGNIHLSTSYKVNPSGNRSESKAIGLSVSQAGGDEPPDVLVRFLDAVGGMGSIFVARRATEVRLPNGEFYAEWKPKWAYRVIRFQHAQAVFCMLWPWLGEVKRAQGVDAFRRRRDWLRERAIRRGEQRDLALFANGSAQRGITREEG